MLPMDDGPTLSLADVSRPFFQERDEYPFFPFSLERGKLRISKTELGNLMFSEVLAVFSSGSFNALLRHFNAPWRI